MPGHVLWEMFAWPSGNVIGNLLASALWATPAFLHLHRKLNRQHAAATAPAPGPGRKHTMKILVDIERDAKLLEQRLGDALPEVEQDAVQLGRTLAGRWLNGGLQAADVTAALRQVAQEVEQQVLTSH